MDYYADASYVVFGWIIEWFGRDALVVLWVPVDWNFFFSSFDGWSQAHLGGNAVFCYDIWPVWIYSDIFQTWLTTFSGSITHPCYWSRDWRLLYRVIKKSLCTWWLQYRKLQVMFKVSHASLQTFIDTPNCVLEDRVQYSAVHIPNVLCDETV